MVVKFPQNIYFYNQQWSNYNILSEIANFDFDYLNAFGGEVNVWFSCFDSFNVNTLVGDFNVKHRPRNESDDNNWTFYYDKNVNLEEYHKNTNYYLKPHRDYLINQYDPKYVIKNNLVIIKSVRDILERNNIKRYTFYKPLKQKWWEEQSNNKCEWFDTGEHYEDIKNHTLGYLVKKDFWKNQNWAKAVYYD
jgi:hypothetical protein